MWSLEGVDSEAVLLLRGDGLEEEMGDFWVLWGPAPMPDAMCAYADEDDPQTPPECPAR